MSEAEKKEVEQERLIGTFLFTRHSESEYTGEYPDLTAKGVEKMKSVAGELYLDDAPLPDLVISTPRTRGLGSADILRSHAQVKAPVRVSHMLRDFDKHDEEGARALHASVVQGKGPGEMDKMLTENYQNLVGMGLERVAESKGHVEERFWRFLTHYIRWLQRRDKKDLQAINIMPLSHFEVLNHFLLLVFPKESNKKLWQKGYLQFAESFKVDVYQTLNSQSKQVLLKITFRDKQATKVLDLHARSLVNN